MRTHLPEKISSVKEAEKFLTELYKNGESYHPDDDAFQVLWELPDDQAPTPSEKQQLNKLMADIFELPEVKRNWPNPEFDPYQVILDLHWDSIET